MGPESKIKQFLLYDGPFLYSICCRVDELYTGEWELYPIQVP